MHNHLQSFLNRAWYGRVRWLLPLWPLAAQFRLLVQRRRDQYLQGKKAVYRAPVPVIVVGNITVGGTGKTPLTIWLVQQLQARGFRPGIVSRGYGGNAPQYPHLIAQNDTAVIAGDEPLMLARRTGVPVMIDPDRSAAVQALLQQTDCNVVISDDGLQHYRLGRTFELVVLDGSRGLGNGELLPVGPLREAEARLQQVDAIVVNGTVRHSSLYALPSAFRHSLRVVPGTFRSLLDHTDCALATVITQPRLVAIAGIGNPQRFFDTLHQLGIQCECRAFPDHHAYSAQDIAGLQDAMLLTTEKDAVKLQGLPGVKGWYLPVDAEVQGDLIDVIIAALQRFELSRQHLN